jgi:hypothetical protein
MANDISNQQLLDALTDQLGVITDNMVTKQDLEERLDERFERFEIEFGKKLDKKLDEKLEKKFTEKLKDVATKSDIARLERRIASNHTVNIKHHLETRASIGNLNAELSGL